VTTDLGKNRIFVRLAGNGYALTWLDKGVRVELRNVRPYGHDVVALCDISCELPGARTAQGSLSCANLKLTSQSDRTTRAKHCAERAGTWEYEGNGRQTKRDGMDFLGLLDEACILTLHAMRDSEPVIVLDDAPDDAETDYDVNGFRFPADGKGAIVTHGEGLKSILLLWCAGTLERRGIPVLYLDWEWTAARHLARKRRLFGAERMPELHYLRMNTDLVRELDRVRRFCDEHRIGHVFVDSIGVAADGPLKDDDVAIRFHKALNDLPPSLSAAHIPKNAIDADARTTVHAFGSVFFENLMRQVWTLKKQESETGDVITVAATSTKQNSGARYPPVGLEFTFTDMRIAVRQVDLATVEGLAERLPLSLRMTHLLQRGPMTYNEIADALGSKLDTVIKTANRGKAFTKVPGTSGTRIALVERRVAHAT
jgi:hypothetical protein